MAITYEKITDTLVKATDPTPQVIVIDTSKLQQEIDRLTNQKQSQVDKFNSDQAAIQANIDSLNAHLKGVTDAGLVQADSEVLSGSNIASYPSA